MSRLGAISCALHAALDSTARLLSDCRSVHTGAATSAVHAGRLWWRGVKTQANAVRVGNVLESEDGRLMAVTKAEYTQGHGRQLGNVQLELQDVKSRAKTTARYR